MRAETLCAIGKATYTLPLESNHQDLEVYRALIARLGLDRVYLIVQSNGRPTVGHVGPILIVRISRLWSAALNHLWFIVASTRIGLRLARKGVALFQASEPSAAGLAGALIKSMTGARLIVHLQGDLFNLPAREFSWWRRWYSRYLTSWVGRKADRVRCVSRALMHAAIGAGVNPERLTLVPSRCDTTRFDRQLYGSDRARLRAEWGVKAGEAVLLSVGSLTIHKGITYLLQAFADVAGQELNAALVLVGAGDLQKPLREEAQALGISGRVRFIGWVPYDQLPPYMAAADLFVLPSLDEGLPRALLEAMSMRLPVIASAVGGVPEVVKHEETGLLVRPADSHGLAVALATALRNPERAEEWSTNARALVERDYSFRAGIERYASMIAQVRAQPRQELSSAR